MHLPDPHPVQADENDEKEFAVSSRTWAVTKSDEFGHDNKNSTIKGLLTSHA